MIVRIRQTVQCRERRHANAGGRSGYLRQYHRAGILIPEEWTEVDATPEQIALLEADPHIEITAAQAADMESK